MGKLRVPQKLEAQKRISNFTRRHGVKNFYVGLIKNIRQQPLKIVQKNKIG